VNDLTRERLEGFLRGRFGRPYRLLEVTGSTNSDALSWAAAGAPEGAVVAADHQTAGRGRGGRAWASRPGAALLFSVLLRPRRPVGELGLLTTAVGVATAEAVEEVAAIRCGLKWPNDVTVGGRKLAGILTETHLEGSVAAVAVAGVGINVAWRREDMPAEVAGRATSTAAEGATVDRSELLAALLVRLEKLYPYACNPETRPRVVERAAARSDVVGRRVRLRRLDGEVLEGEATALLPSGALAVDGRPVTAGEIEWVRTPE
jgi:BirA family biotin operon repressor/biotin-[acetyl-CoA-carboxylase] ligase